MALTQVQTGMLGTGAVLQVVNATYATQTSNSTTTYTDTGLTATITPKFATSKILIIINQPIRISATLDVGGSINIVRNSTVIYAPSDLLQTYMYPNSGSVSMELRTIFSLTWLDSPASTSAITYKTQQASQASGKVIASQYNSAISTITLMEIAG
jgi:hypothetical protein